MLGGWCDDPHCRGGSHRESGDFAVQHFTGRELKAGKGVHVIMQYCCMFAESGFYLHIAIK